MKGIKPYKSIIYIPILLAILISCSNQNKSRIENNLSIENQTFVKKKVDTKNWLIPSHGVREIFEDSKGNMWFSNREFISKYDGSTFTYFNSKNGFLGIATNIHEDSFGNILVETNIQDSLYGISIYDGFKFTFKEFPPKNSNKILDVSEKDIWFNVPIKSKGKWAGTPGVFRYRNNILDFLEFPIPEPENGHNKYWATSKVVQGINGTLWFATIEVIFGFKNGKFTLIDRAKMGRTNDATPVGIRGLFEDKKGNLWLADNGSGLYIYDGLEVINFTEQHNLGKDKKDGNTLHRAFSIGEDDYGNMWFGTVYSGIWRYSKATNEFTNYGEESGVTSENIWMIYKTKNGDLLFAGESPGAVYQFNGNSFDRVY